MMFNLYEMYDRYNLAHTLPWEAYKLENGLIVKINPASDPEYPLKIGHTFKFVSHALYRVGHPIYIKDLNGDVRDKFSPNVIEIRPNGETVFKLYESRVVEKIPLVRMINPEDPDFDWSLLDFTLNGAALFSELLVWIIRSASTKDKLQKS
jgi:hypothetical protein